jgi:hypothetical protein
MLRHVVFKIGGIDWLNEGPNASDKKRWRLPGIGDAEPVDDERGIDSTNSVRGRRVRGSLRNRDRENRTEAAYYRDADWNGWGSLPVHATLFLKALSST